MMKYAFNFAVADVGSVLEHSFVHLTGSYYVIRARSIEACCSWSQTPRARSLARCIRSSDSLKRYDDVQL